MTSASQVNPVRVHAGGATIIGSTDGTTDRFRCVPYANPIVSVADRFSPVRPLPVGSLSEFDATTHPPSPDPHSLSITTPAGASKRGDAGLPVVVFVHGGRYEEGDANEAWYRGTSFAESGCVYVSINYRLRFDGFLPLDGEELPGDYDPATELGYFRGAEDIAEALRWVQRHIANFGGDPNRVTAMGQSAGGALVCWLLTSPRCAGLVQRAVILSCGFPRRGWSQRRRSAARAVRAGSLLSRMTGKAVSITMEDVTALTHRQVDRAYRRFARRFPNDCAVGPFPFQAEAMEPVPMLVGSMRDEFANMVPAPVADKLARRRNPVLSAIGWGMALAAAAWVDLPVAASPVKRKMWARYVKQTGTARPMGRVIGDSVIRRWVSDVAETHGARADTWMYEFVNDTADRHRVAQHCGDLPIVFDALTVTDRRVTHFCGPDARRRLQPVASEFHRVVVEFAHGRQPQWPVYRPDRGRHAMLIDLDDTAVPRWRVARDPLSVVRRLTARCADHHN